jgi:hypothetical protein
MTWGTVPQWHWMLCSFWREQFWSVDDFNNVVRRTVSQESWVLYDEDGTPLRRWDVRDA